MEHQRQEFDEQGALRALEHLRDQIQSARSRREEKIAEFEAFVRSNRSTSQADRLAALDERERQASPVQGAARTAERAAEPVLSARRPEPPVRLDPFGPVHSSSEPGMPAFEFDARPGVIAGGRPIWKDRRFQVAAAVAVLIVLVLVFALSGGSSPDTPTVAATPSSEPPASAPAANVPPPAPAGGVAASQTAQPPAPASRPLRVEVTTLRPVWMRVTVDGERTIEQEVPGGQKLSFGADRAVALRVGDAGAVRLTVDGADQGVLGRDGQVVNRTFTPRPR